MPSILQRLVANANPAHYDKLGFAMLHCAASLKDSELEGANDKQMAIFLKKIVTATNNASDDYLNQNQKDLCQHAIDEIIHFQKIYASYVDTSTDSKTSLDPNILIKEIKKQCEQTGYCYLPGGWMGRPAGHHMAAKITKNADGSYDFCFLNRGAGIKHHDVLGQSDEKTKYDYQSHVYRFDLNSQSAHIFFHGFLSLVAGSLITKSCDAQDLYGLLALHGTLQQTTPDIKRQVTAQRTGTCSVTNSRVAIKDTLLINGGLEPDMVKRYEFFNKLASIVDAYARLQKSAAVQKEESELQLLDIAVNELYVRLEKIYPKGLSKDELTEIRAYADEISAKVKAYKKAIIDEACKEQDMPAFEIHWEPSPIAEEAKPSENAESAAVEDKLAPLKIITPSPEQVKNYLAEGVKYFSQAKKTVQVLWDLKHLYLSLPKTTAEEKDPFWDQVPVDDLTAIIHSLTELNGCLELLKSSDSFEVSLIGYDIAAQIAPRIPELKITSDYCLGLDDEFSSSTNWYEPSTFLSTSHLANNFITRSKSKTTLFNNTLTEVNVNTMQDYVLSLLDDTTKKTILSNAQELQAKEIRHLESNQWIELFLTGSFKHEKGEITCDIMPYLPPALADIRKLANFSPANTNTPVYSQNKANDYWIKAGSYLYQKKIAATYSQSTSGYVPWDDDKIRALIPYEHFPANEETFRELAENVIYQPHATRAVYTNTSQSDVFKYPWSNAYDSNLLSGSCLFPGEDTQARQQIDETFKRLQVDTGFAFQRAISHMENNLESLISNKHERDILQSYMFGYGAVYFALNNAPEETTDQVKNTFKYIYAYFQNRIQELIKPHDPTHPETLMQNELTAFLELSGIETLYRAWAEELHKGYLLDDSFPSCQNKLRELLDKAPRVRQAEIAQALLANLKTLKPLTLEDMQYALASRIITTQYTSQFDFLPYFPVSFQAGEAWHQLKPELNTTLSKLPKDVLNPFIAQVLNIMGFKSLTLEITDWQYENSLLKSTNGRASLNLETGEFIVDGKVILYQNSELIIAKTENLEVLGVDVTKLQLSNLINVNTVQDYQLQADTPDGNTYFLRSFPIDNVAVFSVAKYVTLDGKKYLCDLIFNEYPMTSKLGTEIGSVPWTLEHYNLINPYPKLNDLESKPILWLGRHDDLLFLQHPQKPYKAMMADPQGMWHQLVLSKEEGWQPNGTVLLNPQNDSNPLVKEWGDYCKRFCDPKAILYKATLDKTTNSMQLKTLNIPTLGLHFIAKDNKLYSREHAGYFLSKRQGAEELNGISSIVILENEKGETLYLLPKSPLKGTGTPFYNRNPISTSDQYGYFILTKNAEGKLTAKTAEDNFRLALVFALQGDYEQAMKSLENSYTHKPNDYIIAALMLEYEKIKPNTPNAYAFYYHLHLRFLEHQYKWTKEYTQISDDIVSTLEQDAQNNLTAYMQCISSQRTDVDIIPKYLRIPSSYLTGPESLKPHSQAFTDEKFTKTNKFRLEHSQMLYVNGKPYINNQGILTSHKKQPCLPLYPPVKVQAEEIHTSGMGFNGYQETNVDNNLAYLNAYYVNLYELALSDNPLDTELFHSYLFHILHSNTNQASTQSIINERVGLLRYIHQNRSEFLDLQHDDTTNGLMVAILRHPALRYECDLPELFADTTAAIDVKQYNKAAHWLDKELRLQFSLAHTQFKESIKQPLKEDLDLFVTSTPRPIAVKDQTPTLQTTPSENLIFNKILKNYQTGYEKNLELARNQYTLKPEASLGSHLAKKIVDQQTLLNQSKEDILKFANELPNDPDLQDVCDLLGAARESGKRPTIDINMLIICLLKQNATSLGHSNPFLTQKKTEKLLQSTCDYILEKSKLAQYQEVEKILKEHAKTTPLPDWVEQLIGESLAKERTWSPKEYPEILVYEYATGTMLREGQAEKIIELIKIIESGDLTSYRHALLQFRAGGGKTAVIIPILAHRFARKGLLPVIVNTNELYAIAEQEIPESLKQSLQQNIEVVECELDFRWTVANCKQLLADLQKWQAQEKTLLLKSITWHSLHLANKVALDENDKALVTSTQQILDFFKTQCIKLEDEGHLISDPLQESIRTDRPSQTFSVGQTNLMLDFYHYLIEQDEGYAALVELLGIKDNSLITVSADELTALQKTLIETLGSREELKNLEKDALENYLKSASKEHPEWLNELNKSDSNLADNIARARTFIQIHSQAGYANVVELSGIKDKSKKTVSADELTAIQKELVKKISAREEFKNLEQEALANYLKSASKERPGWLNELHNSDPNLADNIILARAFIQTHLPHIFTLQFQRDYGISKHPGDLTAAPKRDSVSVSSHFADPLLLLALTTQLTHQQGVPEAFILQILTNLKTKHMNQKKFSQKLTQAEMQMVRLLPEKYWYTDIDSMNLSELAKDDAVRFYSPLIDHYLKTFAYPQIKVPKKLYTSTAADLQAGFKASVIFTATPGLPETYPVQLQPENLLLAQEFEAEVISTLLSEKNTQGIMIDAASTPEEFFTNLKNSNPEQFEKMTAFIDRGALLTNYENSKISQALQNLLKDNTLFFENDVMRLESKKDLKSTTLKGTRIIEALQKQGFSLEQVMVFLFLNLAHTTGTDVKRPYQDRAGLSVGKEQTTTEIIQGAMRERQLLRDNAQSIVWVMFQDLYEKINPGVKEFDANKVFLWMIQNEARHDEHKIVMRAYQGINQLIDEFARNTVEDKDSIKDTLFKKVKLSMWDMYELMSTKSDTKEVLNDYIMTLCKQYHIERKDFPEQLEQQITRIVAETAALVPELQTPPGSELSSEIVHEQTEQQEQEQEQEQQQQMQETLLSNYNSNSDIKLMLETYDQKEELDAIFTQQNAEYINCQLPDCQNIPMPKLLLNPRHFTPIQQSDYTQIYLLKPVENIIVQVNSDGSYQYLACSRAGAKVFREQLKARQFTENAPAYFIVDSLGAALFRSSNTTKEQVKICQQSKSFNELMCYLELLNGKITQPERMSEFLKARNTDIETYNRLVTAIKNVHISPSPVELENLPYLESLCGWKEFDEPIKKRMAHAEQRIDTKIAVPERASDPQTELAAKPVIAEYLPDVMDSALPPCVLGLDEKRTTLSWKLKGNDMEPEQEVQMDSTEDIRNFLQKRAAPSRPNTMFNTKNEASNLLETINRCNSFDDAKQQLLEYVTHNPQTLLSKQLQKEFKLDEVVAPAQVYIDKK